MKQFLVLSAFFAAIPQPPAADVFGRWNVDLVNQFGGTMKIVVTFQQDGNKLTGACTGEELGDMAATGETNGNEIKWQCESEEHGGKQIATFIGTLNANGTEMKGEWTTVIKGTFSGNRQR